MPTYIEVYRLMIDWMHAILCMHGDSATLSRRSAWKSKLFCYENFGIAVHRSLILFWGAQHLWNGSDYATAGASKPRQKGGKLLAWFSSFYLSKNW